MLAVSGPASSGERLGIANRVCSLGAVLNGNREPLEDRDRMRLSLSLFICAREEDKEELRERKLSIASSFFFSWKKNSVVTFSNDLVFND